MQVVMSNCFLLNPEKKTSQSLVVFEKKKKKKNRSTPTYTQSVFPLRFWCSACAQVISGFGMLNNGKVKNESACA